MILADPEYRGETLYNAAMRPWGIVKHFGGPSLLLAVAVFALARFSNSLNLATIALALMLVVMLVAVASGRGPALLIATLAGLAFNFFFIQPYHSFRIQDVEDTVAFIAFLITAIIVGQLSSRLEMRVLQTEVQQRKLEAAHEVVTAQAAEAETLRRSEQLKTALLDAVTHDLRTPLTSIKAAVTTVRNPSLPEDVRQELYEVIEQESDRLDRFIGGMMDLARLEAGDIHLESSEVSVDEVVEDALARAEPLLSGHQVEVQVSSPTLRLQADPRLISQVLFTLLDNAAKNSPKGTRIWIAANENEGRVTLTVIDEGPGVPEPLREQVFEKFFRVGERSGYGVGLAVARGIVRAHHGRIWIESGADGRGAAVHFEIPGVVSA